MKDLTLHPIKHRIHWHLTDTQKLCLDMSIIFPIPKDQLYMATVDRKCTAVYAKNAAKTLFAEPIAQEYITERRRWIDEMWFGIRTDEYGNIIQDEEPQKRPRLTPEQRNELAQSIIDEMLITGKAVDATTMRMAIENGLNKTEEERDEKPVIFLPNNCYSCGYQAFCEKNGQIVCPDCKYRKFALKNGSPKWDYKEIIEEGE